MEFHDLYVDGSQSRGTRPMRARDGKIYKYDFKVKKTIEIDEDKIISKTSIVEVMINEKNIIKDCSDVIMYTDIIKNDICKNLLELKETRDGVETNVWHFDFVNLRRLMYYLAKQSIHGEIVVSSPKLLWAIDMASGGGALITKPGTHYGHYYLYDINNSYNSFFVKFSIQSNHEVLKVDKIFKRRFTLYRLKVSKEFLTKDMTRKFKTNRTWFTYTDVKIFDMFGVKYELVNEKNNCVNFKDTIESNFECMRTLNEAKQEICKDVNIPGMMKKVIVKHLLSSFWGNLCRYSCITEKEYGKKIPEKLFHKVGKNTNDDLYINPDKFYLYAVAICKPFVLAEGRYNLLSQVSKVEKLVHQVVYTHTDSIITDCSPEHFDIGCDIGQWKIEKQSGAGVEIKNIRIRLF